MFVTTLTMDRYFMGHRAVRIPIKDTTVQIGRHATMTEAQERARAAVSTVRPQRTEPDVPAYPLGVQHPGLKHRGPRLERVHRKVVWIERDGHLVGAGIVHRGGIDWATVSDSGRRRQRQCRLTGKWENYSRADTISEQADQLMQRWERGWIQRADSEPLYAVSATVWVRVHRKTMTFLGEVLGAHVLYCETLSALAYVLESHFTTVLSPCISAHLLADMAEMKEV